MHKSNKQNKKVIKLYLELLSSYNIIKFRNYIDIHIKSKLDQT